MNNSNYNKVIQLRKENPDMVGRIIAEKVGVSISRVYEYLRKEGLPVAKGYPRPNQQQFGYSNNRVIELRQENPDMTLKAIGEKVGISRERVRQILKREGLTTVSTNGHTTSYRVPRGKCIICGNEIGLDKKIWYSKKGVRHPQYCSQECSGSGLQYRSISFITCYRCGKVKSAPKTEAKWRAIKNEHTYCSRTCVTKAFWENISPEDKAAWVAKQKATRKHTRETRDNNGE